MSYPCSFIINREPNFQRKHAKTNPPEQRETNPWLTHRHLRSRTGSMDLMEKSCKHKPQATSVKHSCLRVLPNLEAAIPILPMCMPCWSQFGHPDITWHKNDITWHHATSVRCNRSTASSISSRPPRQDLTQIYTCWYVHVRVLGSIMNFLNFSGSGIMMLKGKKTKNIVGKHCLKT